jgi:hypothetical protein
MTAGLRAAYRADWIRAHEVLFARRHEHPFAPYHRLMMADFWSDVPQMVFLGFRGSAKSTLAEEYAILGSPADLFKTAR